MNNDIKILKELKEEIKKELDSDYLKNPTEKVKEMAERVANKKQKQIEALDNCIQRLEDLYE